MSQKNVNKSNTKSNKRCTDFDFDNPYFRRSVMMKDDPESKQILLRIEQFLENIGVVQVTIEDEPVYYGTPLKSLYCSPSGKSNNTSKTRISSLNINLGENNLYLRRKTSSNPTNVPFFKSEQ